MIMNELIARLEAATEPSRELDREIADACSLGPDESWERPRTPPARHCAGAWIKGSRLRESPRYTSSLDAALSLFDHLFPDWRVENLSQWESPVLKSRGEWMCDLVAPGDFFTRKSGKCSHSSSPAIALVIATLRAKAQETEK